MKPKTVILNGHRFTWYEWFSKRREADSKASTLRKRGYQARVVQKESFDKRPGFVVYVRKG